MENCWFSATVHGPPEHATPGVKAGTRRRGGPAAQLGREGRAGMEREAAEVEVGGVPEPLLVPAA